MLAAVAASVPDAVVLSGVDGCVRYINPAAERLFGSSVSELRGRHVSLLTSPAEQVRSRGLAARIAGGERVDQPAIMEMQRDDGSCFFAEVTLSPLITGAGEPLTGRLMIYDALDGETRTVRIGADPECPVCGG